MDNVMGLRLGPGRVVNVRSFREKYLDVTPQLVLGMLQIPHEGRRLDGYLVHAVKDAVPMDAKVVRCGITEGGNIRLVIESDSFPIITEGNVIPQLSPQWSQTTIKSKGDNNADGQ